MRPPFFCFVCPGKSGIYVVRRRNVYNQYYFWISASAGVTRGRTGAANQLKVANNEIIIKTAIKKLGMAMPTIVNVRAPKSSQLSGFMAKITPNGTEKITERTIANTASSNVLGIRSPNLLMTDALNQ